MPVNQSIPQNDPERKPSGNRPADNQCDVLCIADTHSHKSTWQNTSLYIQRALSDGLSAPSELGPYGEFASIVEGIDIALHHGGPEAAKKAFDAMCRKDSSLQALLPTSTATPDKPDEECPPREPICPELPNDVLPDIPDEGAGVWLDVYTDFGCAKSPMTPRLFHQGAGLALPSMAVARRLALCMPHDTVYPNLFVAQIAGTTLYRKSTGLKIARNAAFQVFPHLLAAQESSPEALLSDMAGVQPSNFIGGDHDPATVKEWQEARNYAAQRGWILDEMSGLLANSGKDYNAGYLEFLLTAYDCEQQYKRSTRSQGLIVVRDIYVTFLGASTPAALWPYLRDPKLWSMGWWPRFALLTPEDETPPWRMPADKVEQPSALVDGLDRLYRRLPPSAWPNRPTALEVSLGTGVFPIWQQYNKALSHDLLLSRDLDERLMGTYGRLPTLALKVAILLAALDWPESVPAPRIELPHLAKAIRIAETWRASAHRTIDQATRSTYEQTRIRILKVLGRHEPDGATMRDLLRYIKNMDPADLNVTLIQMKMADEIEEVRNTTGRPSSRYRLVRN